MGLADRQADPHEHARRQQPVAALQHGIGEDTAHQDAARRGVDLVVDEVDGPLVRVTLLALEPHEDGHLRAVLGQLDLALVDRPADAQQGGLVHLEIDVHRVHRHDRGQAASGPG